MATERLEQAPLQPFPTGMGNTNNIHVSPPITANPTNTVHNVQRVDGSSSNPIFSPNTERKEETKDAVSNAHEHASSRTSTARKDAVDGSGGSSSSRVPTGTNWNKNTDNDDMLDVEHISQHDTYHSHADNAVSGDVSQARKIEVTSSLVPPVSALSHDTDVVLSSSPSKVIHVDVDLSHYARESVMKSSYSNNYSKMIMLLERAVKTHKAKTGKTISFSPKEIMTGLITNKIQQNEASVQSK